MKGAEPIGAERLVHCLDNITSLQYAWHVIGSWQRQQHKHCMACPHDSPTVHLSCAAVHHPTSKMAAGIVICEHGQLPKLCLKPAIGQAKWL